MAEESRAGFVVRKAVNPKTGADTLFYPQAATYGKIGEKTVSAEVASKCGIEPEMVTMVLNTTLRVAFNYLSKGFTVQIADWGHFFLGLEAHTSNRLEDVSSDNITAVKLRFRVSRLAKSLINAIKFAPFTKRADLRDKEQQAGSSTQNQSSSL